MNDNAESAVIVIDDLGHRIIGFITGYHYGFAKIRYTDAVGIEHEEYLSNEDYIPLEEWTKET